MGQTIKMETIFSQAVKIVDLFAKKKKNHLYHRAFIGESLSKIYQPCYIREDQLFDGIDNRPLGPSSFFETFEGKSFTSKKSWEPKFITTVCPKCADFMEGEPDSLVLHCRNCETLWQEQAGKFTPLKWSVIPSEDRAAKFLPFWKITFQTTGKVLRSFGDFLRLTNQPVVVRKEHDDLDLCFSPHCMSAMRKWLQGEYPSLKALNERWGTAFQAWDEVQPDDTYEAQARGIYVSWSDHRTFMEMTYANFFEFALEELRKLDPEPLP